MRTIAIVLSLASLVLGGCQTDGVNLASNASAPKPKAVVVTDFVYSPDVTVIDRGYTVRLSRKEGGDLPFHLRKERTLERVNDEIVATIVATVRAAGLEAVPGSGDAVSLKDDALIVGGRLAPGKAADKKSKGAGIGDGRGGVVAEMKIERQGSFGRKAVASFTAEPVKTKVDGGAVIAALPEGSRNTGRLSPDVEAQAHALGRGIGDKIVAYAREQGWLGEAVPAAAGPDKKKTGV
ncbi:MAG TPA: hypothetical protein VN655_06465 [Pseudolabrys sp.]|nr:hypothetical protein [Pseudolabrys sp.]